MSGQIDKMSNQNEDLKGHFDYFWILCELRTYKWKEGVIIAVVFAI